MEVIRAKNRHDFSYIMEHELTGSCMPRPVYWKSRTVLRRHLLWNAWGIVLIAAILFARQGRGLNEMFAITLIGIVLPTVYLFLQESRWRLQASLLRTGIAVGGWIASGSITTNRGRSKYHISYCYPVEQKIRQEEVAVTAEQFDNLIYANPYHTILYDANHPGRSMLYQQMQAACLATAVS